MKTQHPLKSMMKYVTITALALSFSAHAIERPTPAAQPKAEIKPAAQHPVENQNSGYLGIAGEPISPLLSNHLKLEEGIGMALKYVVPKSPADIAGLKELDIITKIADKHISTLRDVSKALDGKKIGDTVTINFISHGKNITKKVTLGTRPKTGVGSKALNDQRPENQLGIDKKLFEQFPKKDRERLMRLLMGKKDRFKLPDINEFNKKLKDLENLNNGEIPKLMELPNLKIPHLKGNVHRRIKMLDKDGSVTLESINGQKNIELFDREGKLLYKGPFNNKDDKQKVPENLQHRLDKLNIEITPDDT